MNCIADRIASGKSWVAVAIVFGLLCLNEIASAQPGYDRVARGNTVGIYDSLLNFANLAKEDIAGQVNEEISGSVKERQKRLSDQRRAELETLMALSKMTGKLVNVIRGGRQLEANKNGRKKRSIFDINVRNLQKLFRMSEKLGYKGNGAYPVIS
ncbi:PREDICTED: uncharacterized protein LOC108547499 [Eufriesea mexicana]|uniref:uncharacterized protein LOC108547499 n=1 Tax=Eufriesea mexicana TaxID=516756 RepID=UPI00083C2BB5|nr:PREDICTED: uncharacterized protein LOC108547499 [Eufriesea mexicana]